MRELDVFVHLVMRLSPRRPLGKVNVSPLFLLHRHVVQRPLPLLD